MRERLTLAFVVLTVSALVGALLVRGFALQGDLRDNESNDLRQRGRVAQVVLEQRMELRGPVDTAFLAVLGSDATRVSWTPSSAGSAPVIATGPAYDADDRPQDRISTTVDVMGGRLELTESGSAVSALVTDDQRSVIVLILLVGIIAGLVGWLTARALSAPFRKLAFAADMLGRGRFDLELPRSRLPEVKAISTALHGAAGRLQERLSREQEFAQHASHVLRTPLTGLRLELEELSLRDDVPADVRETVCRSMDRIDSMNVVAGELVQLSRRGALVAGSEVSLRDLATQQAQRWADILAEHDRPLTAAVEGNLDTTYTPGPVEHILDLLLVDVLRRGTGSVRMVFEADGDDNLKIRVTSAGEHKTTRGNVTEVPITQARAVTTALGGRLAGTDPVEGFEILLPRR